MRLAASWLLATNGRTSWPKKECVMTPSNPSCSTRTRERSKRVTGSFMLRAEGRERRPEVVAPLQGWDEKDERWKRAKPILAHPHVLRRSGRQWHCEVCHKRASGGAAKAKLVRTECVGHPAITLGEHARPQCHLLALTGSFMWCCRCGARAAKFVKKLGEPCVGHPRSQEYARSMRLLWSRWHPKENRFLETLKLFTIQAWRRWRQSYQGNNCDRAGLAELRQTVIRLRMAEAQPTNPDDKKHLLLKSGEVKWCWRCGARRAELRAKTVTENRVQWCSPYQGVRESTFLARQRATSEELCVCRASVTHL